MKTQNKQNTLIPEKRLYSIKEGAKYLGCGVYTLRELIWGRVLPVVKYGKKQYLDFYDMNEFIIKNKK